MAAKWYDTVKMSDCSTKFQCFCYICSKFTLKENRVRINGFVQKAYEEYFSECYIKNMSWAPRKICKTCYKGLTDWWNGKHTKMPFSVSMIWTNAGTHNSLNCYVCANFALGMNKRRKHKKVYIAIRSPLLHSDAIHKNLSEWWVSCLYNKANLQIPFRCIDE